MKSRRAPRLKRRKATRRMKGGATWFSGIFGSGQGQETPDGIPLPPQQISPQNPDGISQQTDTLLENLKQSGNPLAEIVSKLKHALLSLNSRVKVLEDRSQP